MIKRKLLLIVLLIVILIGLGIWYFYAQKNAARAETNPEETSKPAVVLPPVENIKAGILQVDTEQFPPIP